jgi:tRNA modification GTPase
VARTIVAVATPPGRGGVGIVRISGHAAVDVLRVLVPDWPAGFPSHKLRLSNVFAGDERVDEALVVFMGGPHSYTGEDVVEVQCHGGPIVLRSVMDACVAAGASVAEPGEFTQRAFLNGRLDLTQAEAVADLINATSESAHRLAMEHLEGSLGEAIREHLVAITEAMVLLEAALDFSHEEHVYQIERDEILVRIDRTLEGLGSLRDRFDRGRRQREGVRVVVMGPTNAGKSSLFNALHGSDRAIVTDIAGTTRDWLEEELVLDGVLVRLVDTAGLRETDDAVESIGIERSRSLGRAADVVVWVLDRTEPLRLPERRELEALSVTHQGLIVCLNKADRDTAVGDTDMVWLQANFSCYDTVFAGESVYTEFLDGLRALAAELTSSEGVLLSRARHLESVVRAIGALERARGAVEGELELELIALDLREALDALGAIVGNVSTDDILNRIFSDFCVGK